MEKYSFNAVVRARLDILNRITTLFIQKNIPVECVTYRKSEEEDGMALVNLVCYAPSDEMAIRRIINQANKLVDIAQVEFNKWK